MAGDFDTRTAHLGRQAGAGVLSGRITVNQVYAHIQHEHTGYRHAPGRIHHYLTVPLQRGRPGWLARLARSAITPTGSDLAAAMRGIVEEWARASARVTPIDENDLPRSHHPQVFDAGRIVYDRPPAQRRLSDAELAAKARRYRRRAW